MVHTLPLVRRNHVIYGAASHAATLRQCNSSGQGLASSGSRAIERWLHCSQQNCRSSPPPHAIGFCYGQSHARSECRRLSPRGRLAFETATNMLTFLAGCSSRFHLNLRYSKVTRSGCNSEVSMANDGEKSSIRFLLNPDSPDAGPACPVPRTDTPPASAGSLHRPPEAVPVLVSHRSSAPHHSLYPFTPVASTTGGSDRRSSVLLALVRKKRKKRTRKQPTVVKLCSEPECQSLVVSRGRCVRHGGGSRCTFPGCTSGAKIQTRCFQHGGSTTCMEPGCSSKAKRYGYCWSHGGGRICSASGCSKVAAQGGLCWAHGGGNRCRAPGCDRRSYQQYGYYCKSHHTATRQPAVEDHV